MVALFHGCVPVFTLGRKRDDDALPFDEVLPWHAFSLRVPVDEMRTAIQEQLSSAEGHLTTLAGEVTSLQAQLAAKNAEVDGLTSSLAQAILNQKVVAEAATKSKGRMSRG